MTHFLDVLSFTVPDSADRAARMPSTRPANALRWPDDHVRRPGRRAAIVTDYAGRPVEGAPVMDLANGTPTTGQSPYGAGTAEPPRHPDGRFKSRLVEVSVGPDEDSTEVPSELLDAMPRRGPVQTFQSAAETIAERRRRLAGS